MAGLKNWLMVQEKPVWIFNPDFRVRGKPLQKIDPILGPKGKGSEYKPCHQGCKGW